MKDKFYIEPPEQERKYQRMERLGQELGIPIPRMHLEMQVTMPDGKVVHHHKQRSHSWNRNAYNWLFSQIASVNGDGATFGAGKISITTTTGSHKTGTYSIGLDTDYGAEIAITGVGHSYTGYRMASGVAAGIVVGSSDAAENFEDYALTTQIVEGTGAGQLNHVQSEAITKAYNTGTKTMTATHVRYFNNNSGGDVLVNEIAIYAHLCADDDNLFWTMVSRDLLASTVTVPDTGQLKVTYEISLVYPA